MLDFIETLVARSNHSISLQYSHALWQTELGKEDMGIYSTMQMMNDSVYGQIS